MVGARVVHNWCTRDWIQTGVLGRHHRRLQDEPVQQEAVFSRFSHRGSPARRGIRKRREANLESPSLSVVFEQPT